MQAPRLDRRGTEAPGDRGFFISGAATDNGAMCGRYVSPEQAEIERFWHIGRHNNEPFGRRYNVVPTQIIPILRLDRDSGELDVVHARWGLIPNWWKEVKPPRVSHNARAEEAATKPMWRGALARSRCL